MKTCKKCGTSFTLVNCPECARAWVAKNRERVRAKRKQYNVENKEKIIEAVRQYRLAHPRQRAEHYARNAEKYRAKSANWRANNPEKLRAAKAIYRRENKEALSVERQNRRAHVKKNGGKLSRGIVEKLYRLQKGKCPCCRQPLGDDYHLDHIVALARGGTNTDGNVQLLRSMCNLNKAAKHPVEFMQSRGFLL